MKKQFLAIVLTIALVLTLMPAATFADEEVSTSVESGTETVLDNNAVNENENGETAENVPEVIAPETEGSENNGNEITAPEAGTGSENGGNENGAADENSTDVPTDVPTDEPTDVPTENPTDVPADEPTDVPTEDNAEFEAVLNAYREMEVTPFNLRRLIDILGLTPWFEEDDVYYSDDALMATFEGYSMPDIVDSLAGMGSTTFGLGEDVDGNTVSKANISVVSAAGTLQNTYSVQYGTQTGLYNYVYAADGGDLVIKPAEGYKIESAMLNIGYYYEDAADDVGQRNLVEAGFYNDGKIVIAGEVLSSSDAGFYPVKEGRSYKIEITITTAKADAGLITLTEDGTGATYSMTTTSTATGVLSAVQEAINNQIEAKTIVAGTKITFTVDSTKIAKVTVNGEEQPLQNDSFTVTASESAMDIVFTYKAAASLASITVTSNSTVFYDLTVNGTVKSYLSEEQLKKEIAKCYVGDNAVIKVNLPNNQSINSASLGDSALSVVNNAFSVELGKDMVITLAVKAENLELTVSQYNGANIDALGNAVFVVAQITNIGVLDEEKITNPTFEVTRINSENPAANTLYKNQVVDAARNGAYFAMGFEPKYDDAYTFGYTIDVTATVRYNGTPVSKVATININK